MSLGLFWSRRIAPNRDGAGAHGRSPALALAASITSRAPGAGNMALSITGVLIVIVVLVSTVRYFVCPGKQDPDHMKRCILEDGDWKGWTAAPRDPNRGSRLPRQNA